MERDRTTVAPSRRWKVSLVVIVVALAVSCAALGGPAGPAGRPWAREAQTWISAYDDAVRSLDEPGRVRVADFYATDVVLDGYEDFYGRLPVIEVELSIAHSTARHEFGETYLDGSGFLRSETTVWSEAGRAPTPSLRLWEVAPDGIVLMTALDWLQSPLVRDNPAFDTGRTRAEALAQQHVRAWSESDFATLRRLYAPSATYTDDVRGVRVRGREAIVALADPDTATDGALQPASALYEADILAAAGLPAGGPAVFATRDYLGQQTGEPEVMVLLQLSATRCPGASAVVLTVDGTGLVVAERRLRALASARRCSPPGDPRDAWWVGRGRPVPLSERVTGRVDSPSGPIEIRNGTPELEEFVRWGLGRFQDAGLPPPHVRSVAFDPFAAACSDFDGYASTHGGSAAILICADVAGIARRALVSHPACAEVGCATSHWNRRALLLHELGHAWVDSHLDRAERDRFTRVAGSPSWDGDAVPYAERGVELAASALAWGLSDGSTGRPMPDSAECEVLAQRFRLLTGAEPLVACPTL